MKRRGGTRNDRCHGAPIPADSVEALMAWLEAEFPERNLTMMPHTHTKTLEAQADTATRTSENLVEYWSLRFGLATPCCELLSPS